MAQPKSLESLEVEIMQSIQDPDKVEALLKQAATVNGGFSNDVKGKFLVAAADATEIILGTKETTEAKQCRVMEILLEQGANVNQTNERQETALHIAALRGYVQMANLLRNNKDIDITLRERTGSTAMDLARKFCQFLDTAIATNEGWDKIQRRVFEFGGIERRKPGQ